jgi:hypothetical protein
MGHFHISREDLGNRQSHALSISDFLVSFVKLRGFSKYLSPERFVWRRLLVDDDLADEEQY